MSVCVCDRAESQFFDPTAHSVSDPEEEILIIYYTIIISLFYVGFQSKVYMDWYNYIKPVWDFNYFPRRNDWGMPFVTKRFAPFYTVSVSSTARIWLHLP